MITKILADNGLFLGDAKLLLGVNPKYPIDNPKGYWEYEPAIRLSNKILHKLGGSWREPPDFSDPNIFDETSFHEEIEEARTHFSSFPKVNLPWGWKDPRNSLLIDFWRLVFPDLKLLVCLRNPYETAFSLSKRTIEHVDFLDGIELWNVYNKNILGRIQEFNSLVTHYESYFYDPKTELERVGDFIGLKKDLFTNDYDISFIDSGLYRVVIPSEININETCAEQARIIYEGLCDYAGNVYQRLNQDTVYQEKKYVLATNQLLRISTQTFDEMHEKLTQKKLEIKQVVIDHELTSAKLQEEIDQITSSRLWNFLNRFRMFYGKIFWGVRGFLLSNRNKEH